MGSQGDCLIIPPPPTPPPPPRMLLGLSYLPVILTTDWFDICAMVCYHKNNLIIVVEEIAEITGKFS